MINIILKEGIIIMIITKSNISWDQFDHQLKEVFGMKMKHIDDLYFNVIKRIDIGEFTELEDMKSLNYLQDLRKMNGELCVITDYCYEEKCGPFIIDASKINDFVKNFYMEYGTAFYSTDVIIINFAEELIWVLFHEGICWLTKGRFIDRRKYVKDEDDLLKVAEEAAGGDLDKFIEIKPFYYINKNETIQIEWNLKGHINTNEGPHVKIEHSNGKGDWTVVDKYYIEGRNYY